MNTLTNIHSMQAIIMAGGKGTRLQNLTKDVIPKPLVKIHNKPILDYVIEHAIKNGCDDIIICTGYLSHKILQHIKNKQYGASIRISEEKEPLGTAGALNAIADLLDDEFFIIYADVYTTISFKKMLQFHKKRKADVTIAVHASDHPHDSTIVKIDKNGKILEMIEKPGENWKQYGNLTQTSLYLMKKEVINFITKNAKLDFEKDIFSKMLMQGSRIYGYFTKEYAKDIGTPDRYHAVVNKILYATKLIH